MDMDNRSQVGVSCGDYRIIYVVGEAFNDLHPRVRELVNIHTAMCGYCGSSSFTTSIQGMVETAEARERFEEIIAEITGDKI